MGAQGDVSGSDAGVPVTEPVLEIYVVHLRVGVYCLFHRLYGMYPYHLISHLRDVYSRRSQSNAVFDEMIQVRRGECSRLTVTPARFVQRHDRDRRSLFCKKCTLNRTNEMERAETIIQINVLSEKNPVPQFVDDLLPQFVDDLWESVITIL